MSECFQNNNLYHPQNLQKPKKTRKTAIVESLDYQIPVTQLKAQKGNEDMQAEKRD